MTNTMICSNPDCGNSMSYNPGDIEVICAVCGTWHPVSENDPGISAPDSSFDMEELYVPEEPPTFSDDKGGDPLPDELIGEEADSVGAENTDQEVIAQLVDQKGNTYPLVEGKNTLGRKGSQVVIDDQTVSRNHCVIEVTKSPEGIFQYHIYDIGFEEGTPSTNGVFVSGRTQRLQDYEKLPVYIGSTFRIGETSLKIKDGNH